MKKRQESTWKGKGARQLLLWPLVIEKKRHYDDFGKKNVNFPDKQS